ncbi:MAG: RhuM family protein [Clostridia bacterium]
MHNRQALSTPKNIYAEDELTPQATTEKFSVVRQEGARQVRRTLEHYKLDAIIVVGYRVNSKKPPDSASGLQKRERVHQ